MTIHGVSSGYTEQPTKENRMQSTPTAHPLLRAYTGVLSAALSGGEDEVRRALSALDEKALHRLRNLIAVLDHLTGHRIQHLRRNR